MIVEILVGILAAVMGVLAYQIQRLQWTLTARPRPQAEPAKPETVKHLERKTADETAPGMCSGLLVVEPLKALPGPAALSTAKTEEAKPHSVMAEFVAYLEECQ